MDIRKVTGLNMECPECFERFDELGRRPKALPCGHAFCLKCLETVDRCFIDKKEFTLLPIELPDHHNSMAMLRSNINSTSGSYVHVFCRHCNKPAEEKCIIEKHKISSRKQFLFEQLVQKLNLTDSPFHPQNSQKVVESLTEVEVAEAIQMMSGQTTPTNILLKGGNTRWLAELPQGCGKDDDDNAKIFRSILFLLRQKGILPQEVILTAEVKKPIQKPKVDPECVLDLNNITSGKDQTRYTTEKEKLMSEDQLLKIRRLIGLYCDGDKKWTHRLLQRLAPVLEEVHLYNFHLEHLEAVLAMPELRWLVLEDTKIPNMKDDELPKIALQHQSKVEFLWANVFNRNYEDRLCKFIVKKFQASVQILCVPLLEYHAHAVSFFGDLELPNLKMLLYMSSYCFNDNCAKVMVALRKRFPGLKIVCLACDRTDNFDD